jgi:Fasciclin domain
MKIFNNKISLSCLALAAVGLSITSCNKDVQQFDIPVVASTSSITIDSIIKTTGTDSLYYRLMRKASLGPINFVNILKNNTNGNKYTIFIPSNAAMLASGLDSTAIANIPVLNATILVGYNVIPQAYESSAIPETFPNLSVGTLVPLTLLSPTAPSWLTLNSFLSKRTSNNTSLYRVNGTPITSAVDVPALNGVIHHISFVNAPPTLGTLWDKIAGDVAPTTGLTYLQAAIIRADSATNAGGTARPGTLEAALRNPAANLTVFAPTDAVFQATLTGLLVSKGVPVATATFLASTPGIFSNPALYSSLGAQTVQGLIVYHLLGSRAFTENFPTAVKNYPTLLNNAVPNHPGIGLASVFSGPFVASSTVKGLINANDANLISNTTAAGSNNQLYINGILHKISQVLLPINP